MRRVVIGFVVAMAAAALAALVTASAQPAPDDEAPIIVRNGSMIIQTEGGTFVKQGPATEAYRHATTRGKHKNSLWVKVLSSAPGCKGPVQGTKVTVNYSGVEDKDHREERRAPGGRVQPPGLFAIGIHPVRDRRHLDVQPETYGPGQDLHLFIRDRESLPVRVTRYCASHPSPARVDMITSGRRPVTVTECATARGTITNMPARSGSVRSAIRAVPSPAMTYRNSSASS